MNMNVSEMRTNKDALGKKTATAAKKKKIWSNSNYVLFLKDYYRWSKTVLTNENNISGETLWVIFIAL